MDKLIIKLFGINRLNFVGWVFAGLVVLFGALFVWLVGVMFLLDNHLEMAIFMAVTSVMLLLVGIFGVLGSIYCALYAEKLEKKDDLWKSLDGARTGNDESERQAGEPAAQAAGAGIMTRTPDA